MQILLDIDGVMVPAKSWSSPPILEDGFYKFNTKSVKALNEIISKSKASIVLTTSHKDNFTIKKWISLFKKREIIVHGLRKLPSNLNYSSRLEEILDWYSLNENLQDFVIIDDDKSLNNLPKHLKARLVQTKPMIGLNSSHVKDSLRILNSPPVQLV